MEEEDGAGSAASSCVSVRSDRSKEQPPNFSNEPAATIVEQERAEVSTGQSAQQHQTHLDSVVMRLEDNITMFVKNELKKIQKLLSPDHPETLKSQMEDEEMFGGEDEDERKSCREAFLKITLHFLRRLKQHEMADHLQSKIFAPLCKRELKAQLKKKFQCVFEGIAKAGSPTLLNQIYTELHITEGGTAEVNDEQTDGMVKAMFILLQEHCTSPQSTGIYLELEGTCKVRGSKYRSTAEESLGSFKPHEW
ncbi:uncharacterized protein LOC120433798 [Oreochromis aureus]|uniref:uncharacterized protein LOC120433798 n=1 Tax=Oreochromis aureus TaxID=47969 RepID=UPI0019541927|nr:uncharacterized protein LOC120433798 [Oreochromis aureus]